MEPTAKPEKAKRSREEILEIIVAIFLGVTALATAWASWISSLHGSNQATNYTLSNNLAAEGNAMYNEGSMSLVQDMLLWNEISSTRIEYTFAEEQNDADAMEKYDWKLQQLLDDNCSEDMINAILWSDEQEESVSPFLMDGMLDSYYADALEKLAESEAALKQGKQDNANGDAYGLTTVIYSVVLFMLGIVGTFKHLPNRFLIMVIAIVGFLGATVYMLTLPLPTGFNLLSFFGM